MFIVVTMYNEDAILFQKTMRGVQSNIASFLEYNPKYNTDKIAVIVIQDGIMK